MPVMDTTGPENPWDKVHRALANPKFDFRTVLGIARDTGLEASEVLMLLNDQSSEVRIAYSTDKKGNLLYTLRNRPKSLQESISNVITIVSSTTSSST